MSLIPSPPKVGISKVLPWALQLTVGAGDGLRCLCSWRQWAIHGNFLSSFPLLEAILLHTSIALVRMEFGLLLSVLQYVMVTLVHCTGSRIAWYIECPDLGTHPVY